MRVNAFGFPVGSQKKDYKKQNNKNKRLYHCSFFSSAPKTSLKNLIVIYDIPEEKKKERDWFRRHLKRFGFSMIQRSVWVGPSPLPKDFLEYIKEIKLKKTFKTFKLAKPYIGKS